MMLKNGGLSCELGKRVQKLFLRVPIKSDDHRQDQDDHDDHSDHETDEHDIDDDDDQLPLGMPIKPDDDILS